MPKSSVFRGLILLLLGAMLLLGSLSQPRIQMLHGADIVKLMGCGALFAIGMAGLFGGLRLPEK